MRAYELASHTLVRVTLPVTCTVLPSNNLESAESVGAVGSKWENQHRFEVLVSCEYSHA